MRHQAEEAISASARAYELSRTSVMRIVSLRSPLMCVAKLPSRARNVTLMAESRLD
jgi:hypothetical protein